MAEDLNKLEREIELDLARWAHRLDVPPPVESVESVRAIVQVEVQAAWMAAQPSPLPSPAALQRVRSAVAAELAGARTRRGLLLQRWMSAPGMGSIGAAAMLVMCIGVIWYAGTLASSAGPRDLEQLLAAVTDSATDPILDEVRSLADDLNEDAALSTDDDEESLGDLVREMDQLLDEHSPAKGTSQIGVKRSGAVG